MSPIVPLKRCTKCHQEFPMTLEFFVNAKHHKDGLSSHCRTCINKKNKAYRDADPDRAKQQTKAGMQRYREKNPERIHELERARYYKDVKQSRQRGRIKAKRWRDNHPDQVRAINQRGGQQRRRARVRSLPATFTAQDWTNALEYFHGCCAYCQKPPSMFDVHTTLHREHFRPATQGGGYTPDNIIPACEFCNLSKGDKDAKSWLTQRYSKAKTKVILKRIQDYFESLTY